MTASDKIIKWLGKGSWDVKLAEEAAEFVWGTGASIPPTKERTGKDFASFQKKLCELVAKRIKKKAPKSVLRALAMSALVGEAAKAGRELAMSLK